MRGFIENTTETLLRALQETLFAEETARSRGLLQSCDARVKLAGIGALIISAVAVRRIWILVALLGIAVLLAILSKISLSSLVQRIWIPVLAFTGVIALPAIFLVPGAIIYRVPLLGWLITITGVKSAVFLVGRSETTATLALLLVLSTSWNRLLRALRFFRIPLTVVLILEMAYRYIFLLLRTTEKMIESRRVRLVGYAGPAVQRRLAASTVGVLLDKTLQLSNEVHLAMQARGFRGDVRLLEHVQMRRTDWFQLISLLAVAFFAAWIGR